MLLRSGIESAFEPPENLGIKRAWQVKKSLCFILNLLFSGHHAKRPLSSATLLRSPALRSRQLHRFRDGQLVMCRTANHSSGFFRLISTCCARKGHDKTGVGRFGLNEGRPDAFQTKSTATHEVHARVTGWHERGREMYLAQESNLQAAAAIHPAHPARKRVRLATLEQGLFTF